MFELTFDVNWTTIFVAAVASMALGFFWYSESFLGKPWMEDMGFTEKSMKKAQEGMGKMYGLTFVLSLVTSFILYNFLESGENMFMITFLLWLGFVLPVQVTDVIFNKKQRWTAFWVNTSYQLASLFIMTLVIGYLM